MRVYKNKFLAILLVFSMLISFFGIQPEYVRADETNIKLEIAGTYNQDDARAMLNMINDFRTGRVLDGDQEQVWALNSDNQIETEPYMDLGELEYDYTLEKIAMERAMELVLEWSHDRPNKEPFDTVLIEGYKSSGENLAAGFDGKCETAQDTFDALREEKEDYVGQGHRRNMLVKDYTCVGIAHLVVEVEYQIPGSEKTYTRKINYWVQEFGVEHGPNGQVETEPVNQEVSKEIEVSPETLKALGIEANPGTINLVYGDEVLIEGISTKIVTDTTWPKNPVVVRHYNEGGTEEFELQHEIEVADEYTYSSEDESIASIAGATVIAKGVGKTIIEIISKYHNVDMPGVQKDTSTKIEVNVDAASILEAEITIDEENLTYTGDEKTPDLTVTLGDKELVKDVDFTASFLKNVDAGEALVEIIGVGNYKDIVNKTFVIAPADISKSNVSGIEDKYAETGEEIKPEPIVSITLGEEIILEKDVDYTLTYSDNTEVGTAKVTIEGKGNFDGTIEKTFDINHVIEKKEAKEPTCEEDGSISHFKCSVCGKVFSDEMGEKELEEEAVTIKALGHYYGKWYRYSSNQHYRICARDHSHLEMQPHVWDEGTVIKESTRTEEGVMEYKCVDCNYAYTDSIPKLEMWERLAGQNAYDTMKAIIDEGFTTTGGRVIVSTGAEYYDALSASGFAGLFNAPIVLTKKDTLSPQAKEVLERLKPSVVYITGGEGAVSADVEEAIKEVTGVNPLRAYGQTATGTSAALALAGRNRWSKDEKIAIISTNASFHDALSIAPIAYAKKYPVLLSEKGKSLSNHVMTALRTLGIEEVIIVGGEAAVGKGVEDQLTAAGIAIKTRLFGETAIETSREIAKWGIENGMSADKMAFATSASHYDALSGAALCGLNNSVLLLEKYGATSIPKRTNTHIPSEYKDVITKGYIFGGTAAVSEVTHKALEEAVA